ncbi:MAG: hypothetical protein JWN01_1061, partial [Patescibacteria group bacterium]|nr:hypothetical protein [Patescibacteria group bacterium]
VAQNAIDDVRPETTDQLVAAAYSAEREKAATAKADRVQRLVVDGSPGRGESTDMVYRAAAETAKGKLAAAKGERAAIRLAAETSPVSTAKLIRAAELDSQKKLSAALGMVEGSIEAADSAAHSGGYRPGSVAADQARILQAAHAGQIGQANKDLQSHADEKAAIRNDLEQRTQATAENRDYHADLIEGGYQTASANLGKQTGALVGAAKNARALAGTPQAPSTANNVKAGIVAGVDAAAKTTGAATGAARTYGTATAPEAAKAVAQKAATEAAFSAVEGVKQATGFNDSVTEEEQRLMDADSTLTREQASNKILENIAAAGVYDGQVTGTKRVGNARGTAEGVTTAIASEKAKALETGQGQISDAKARSNIIRNAEGKAQRDAFNQVTGDASQNRGIAKTRIAAAEKVARDLADRAGEDFDALNDADKAVYMAHAGDNIDRAADNLDELAGQDIVTQGIGKAMGGNRIYDKAVELEAENTLANDEIFDRDVRLEDGTVVAAGKTLKAGTTLLPGTMPASAAKISRREAVARIAQKGISASIEQNVRAQAAKQGDVSALSLAADLGTATDEDRIAGNKQSGLDKIVEETAGYQAKKEFVDTPMQHGYEQSVEEARDAKIQSELAHKIAEAKERNITYQDENGVDIKSRIKNVPNDGPGKKALKKMAVDAKAIGDNATMMAAMRQLGIASGGRQILSELQGEFGGSPAEEVIPGVTLQNFAVKSTPGTEAELWETTMDGVKLEGSPDLLKGRRGAFTNVSAKALTSWDKDTVGRYTKFIDEVNKDYKTVEKALERTDLTEDQEKLLINKQKDLTKLRTQAINELRQSDYQARRGQSADNYTREERRTVEKFYEDHSDPSKPDDFISADIMPGYGKDDPEPSEILP